MILSALLIVLTSAMRYFTAHNSVSSSMVHVRHHMSILEHYACLTPSASGSPFIGTLCTDKNRALNKQ